MHLFDLKLLLNHALPAEDEVTQGYIRPSLEHLAGACEAVAGFLLERAGRQVEAARESREAQDLRALDE